MENGAIIVNELKFILGDVGPGKHFDPYYPSNDTRPPADDPVGQEQTGPLVHCWPAVSPPRRHIALTSRRDFRASARVLLGD